MNTASHMDPIHILTMKWGDLYGSDYVNRLYRGVARHLSRPHQFVCFTDDTRGLEEGIVTYPLPELGLPPGQGDTRWRKLGLFASPLFDLHGTALFLDLDLVIVGDLDVFFEDDAPFRIIRDDSLFRAKPLRRLNPKRDAFLSTVGNSSVFRFEIGAHSYILDRFVEDPGAALAGFEISQQFQTAQLAQHGHLAYWPEDWCVSFKNQCVPHGLASYVTDPSLPDGARIVVFAGNPKMSDALNGKGGKWYRRIGDVRWLNAAWRGEDVGDTCD